MIAFNDDWKDSQEAEIDAAQLAQATTANRLSEIRPFGRLHRDRTWEGKHNWRGFGGGLSRAVNLLPGVVAAT